MHLSYAGRSFDIEGVSKADYISRRIAETGTFYEADLLRYLTQMRIHGQVAIDVGAQIGNHSVFLANFIADRVVSVEPNPETLPTLRRNIERNSGRYTVVEAGLSATGGRGGLHLPDEGNVGTMQVTDGDVVAITTLDAIAPDGVVLVKIDVEGMELAVLRGGERLLRTQRPHLVIEASTPAAHEAHRTFLAPYGYRPLTWWGATPTWHFAYRPSLPMQARSHALRFAFRVRRLVRRRLGRER